MKATARKLSVEQRQELFDALNKWITKQGGWIVSPPGAKYIRVEIPQGSSLPVQLEKAGHRLRHAGMTTRIDGGIFHTVDVLELDLGR